MTPDEPAMAELSVALTRGIIRAVDVHVNDDFRSGVQPLGFAA